MLMNNFLSTAVSCSANVFVYALWYNNISFKNKIKVLPS